MQKETSYLPEKQNNSVKDTSATKTTKTMQNSPSPSLQSSPSVVATKSVQSPLTKADISLLSEHEEDLDLMERNTENEILIQDLRQELIGMKVKMRMIQEKRYSNLFDLYDEDVSKLHTENQALLKENQDISIKYQRDLLKKHSSKESLSFYVHNHYKSLKQENQQLKMKLYKMMRRPSETMKGDSIESAGDDHKKSNLLNASSSKMNSSFASQSRASSPLTRSSIYREGNAVLRRKMDQMNEQVEELKLEVQRELSHSSHFVSVPDST